MHRSDLYLVIGHPVAHSKSPQIHSAFAAQTGQHIEFERRLAPLDGFSAAVRHFIQDGGKGMSVTVPFKQEAYLLADELTDRARAAGAVNTLKIVDGRILGDNTDGSGLVRDIEQNAGVSLKNRSVLLLGAGGAARGSILPLLQAGVASLTIANRTASKAKALAHAYSAHGQISARDFSELRDGFDVVINATSASLGDELPGVNSSIFAPHVLAYDMMYGKKPTVFMDHASNHRAKTRDGLGMLVEQAAEAFFLWRGIRPETSEVYSTLSMTLS